MNHRSALIALFVSLSLPALGAGFSLGYGSGPAEVGFINETIRPNVEELDPIGPASFRVVDGAAYVLDTVGGRLLKLGPGGDQNVTVTPLPTAPDRLFQDFAFGKRPDGTAVVYVVAVDTQEILAITPKGDQVAKLGGLGEEPGKFTQIARIEVGGSGRIYVADVGRQTLTVLDPSGKAIREVHWEWSGFALDTKENLARLRYDDRSKQNTLVIESPEGKVVRETPLAIEEHMNPDLWALDEDGAAWLTYVEAAGFKGQLQFVRCGPDGKPTFRQKLTPPRVMTRFLSRDRDGRFHLGVGDFGAAPKGRFAIEPFETGAR